VEPERSEPRGGAPVPVKGLQPSLFCATTDVIIILLLSTVLVRGPSASPWRRSHRLGRATNRRRASSYLASPGTMHLDVSRAALQPLDVPTWDGSSKTATHPREKVRPRTVPPPYPTTNQPFPSATKVDCPGL
jgi:hypothetical protein